MSYRLAESLVVMRQQVNDAAPDRSKKSDGWIGDTDHQNRASDHNPWIRDGSFGVVSALDLTHDPLGGMNGYLLVESLRASRDPRIKYVIFAGRLFSSYSTSTREAWQWGPYTGPNRHANHVHISVQPSKGLYDDPLPWSIEVDRPPIDVPPDDEGEEEPMTFGTAVLEVFRAWDKKLGGYPTGAGGENRVQRVRRIAHSLVSGDRTIAGLQASLGAQAAKDPRAAAARKAAHANKPLIPGWAARV